VGPDAWTPRSARRGCAPSGHMGIGRRLWSSMNGGHGDRSGGSAPVFRMSRGQCVPCGGDSTRQENCWGLVRALDRPVDRQALARLNDIAAVARGRIDLRPGADGGQRAAGRELGRIPGPGNAGNGEEGSHHEEFPRGARRLVDITVDGERGYASRGATLLEACGSRGRHAQLCYLATLTPVNGAGMRVGSGRIADAGFCRLLAEKAEARHWSVTRFERGVPAAQWLEFLASSSTWTLAAPERRRWMVSYAADPGRYGDPPGASGRGAGCGPAGEHQPGRLRGRFRSLAVKYDNDRISAITRAASCCYKCVGRTA